MVGISVLVGLKSVVLLMTYYFLKDLLRWVSVTLLYASLIAALVSLASLPFINLPLLLGKKSDGSFPIWSIAIFGPYLFFIRMFVLLRRWKIGEPVYTEVLEGLYVGGWPSSLEHLPPGEPAVIDCTCELPRTTATSNNAYLCIATWDTRSPDPLSIEAAVRFACRKRSQKKAVYVHCAFGHGRSICVLCAILVSLGIAEDWKDAEKIIREKRPFIKMNTLHLWNLEEWAKHRLSSKRTCGIDISSGIPHGISENR